MAMANSLKNPATLSSSLLDDAARAAKRDGRTWIFKTLHEVFWQGLQQVWKVEPTDIPKNTNTATNNNAASTRFQVSAEDVEHAQRLVECVAKSWQEKLRQQQYYEFADWVQDVLQEGRQTLWRCEEGSEAERKLPANAATDRNDTHASTTTNEASSRLRIPYSELRQLGKIRKPASDTTATMPADSASPASSSSSRKENTSSWLEKVRQMSREGCSYWPNDEEEMEQVVQEIPERLAEKREKASTASSNLPYQIIPKTLWEKKRAAATTRTSTNTSAASEPTEGNPTETTTTVDEMDDAVEASTLWQSTNPRLARLLQKKQKKSVQGRAGRNPQDQGSSTGAGKDDENNRTDMVDTPRPPSQISSCQLDPQELSSGEKASLNTMVDDDDDTNDGAGMNTLFGGLKAVGQIHYQLQTPIDHPNEPHLLDQENENSSSLSPQAKKRRRRLERAAIQERINPHVVEKNKDLQKHNYRSQVLRTEERNSADSNHPKTYWNLDMGWSLLELQQPYPHTNSTTTPQPSSKDDVDQQSPLELDGSTIANTSGTAFGKRLYVFSSVEMELKEE